MVLMNRRIFQLPMPKDWLTGGIISILAAVLGILSFVRLGGAVTRLSYDLPFAARGNLRADEVALVYLDELSHHELNQSLTSPWDRKLHARLIEKLVADGAKAIVFDILFTTPSLNAEADKELAQAIRQSRRVILSGNYGKTETTPGAVASWQEIPFAPFAVGAAGWGNVNLLPDPDYGIRSHFPNLKDSADQKTVAWLPWAVAEFAGAPVTKTESASKAERYLNYYGPPGRLPGASYSRALALDGVAPGFFKNKVVFVGAQLSSDFSGKGKDEFATPYTRWGSGFAPGVEIHATAFLNLLRGDWLVRLPFGIEVMLVVLTALLSGFGLLRLPPLTATFAALAGTLIIASIAHASVWYAQVWFGWVTLVLQLGFGLFCSVAYNSLRLLIEKRLLEQSLAAHLSPALVKRVLKEPGLRRPGGTKQEVSILFTDIANFSRVSESMDADDLVNLLNRYFEAALKCIHDNDGTVMDLIGDAIFAIWNAPVSQPDHQERACRAAMQLHRQLLDFDTTNRSLPLRTRAGVHTGTVCVGNIGSEKRFDYTAIGPSTNLASRLEGLNRHLGTDVLATRDIQKAVENKLTSRLIGHFQFKGFGRPVEVHELLGPSDLAQQTQLWRDRFAEALQRFRLKEFDNAEAAFRETIKLRRAAEDSAADKKGFPVEDGPSLFYLNQITVLRVTPPPYEWIGEVTLKDK